MRSHEGPRASESNSVLFEFGINNGTGLFSPPFTLPGWGKIAGNFVEALGKSFGNLSEKRSLRFREASGERGLPPLPSDATCADDGHILEAKASPPEIDL